MKKLRIFLILTLPLWLIPVGCQKADQPEENETEIELKNTYLYVNTFARNIMNLYYLWNAEIKSDIDAWENTDEPISKVADIRYHTGTGRDRTDVDRWTALYDDFSSFYGSVTGNRKTCGFDLKVYGYDEKTVCCVVTYTYADSPARAAGLQRGDVIYKVNGKALNRDPDDSNRVSQEAIRIISDELLGGNEVKVDFLRLQEVDGKLKYGSMSCSMSAREMYENPVLLTKVFDCGDKKVGYLVFTSFTLEACKDLLRVANEFKAEGVKELILDLRYNGGGFVITENFLATLLAPEADVEAGGVLSTEVYNAELTQYFQRIGEESSTCFQTDFTFNADEDDEYTLSTAGANIGITKLYAIIDSGTASASEAIICDLYPYLDITLVGQKSHGKYCSGLMYDGPRFYDTYADQLEANTVRQGKKYTQNWGLYVMYSRFADKNGETRCMPDGLTPDFSVKDDPFDSFQFGDPQETMLAEALKQAGYTAKSPAARKRSVERLPIEQISGIDPFRPEFGMRIKLCK